MSTRGYYGIRKKGELKGAYNHWDSYPTGLGKDLVKTINKIPKDERLDVLSDVFNYIELIDESSKPTKEQINKCLEANVVNLNVSYQTTDDWYCLLRETQGNLQIYIDKVIPYMANGNDFLEDSLFCEWAYIIDLDEETFNIYTSGKNLVYQMPLKNLEEKKLEEI